MNILLLLLAVVVVGYGLLWVLSIKTYPVTYGISFNQYHAESLGLDWQETYEAMLKELQPPIIRIAAMWSEIEPTQGEYRFDNVDWMMSKAEEYNAKVLLVVGQKAPRWPECHVPDWAQAYEDPYDPRVADALLQYVTKTVERYKDHPALELWQVENEAFIRFEFGECENFRQDLVLAEIETVRRLDPERKIVMTDSGELASWRRPSWYGDILGTTLYRIVQTPQGTTFGYDWLPASFYKLKARFWGKGYNEFFVAELQAEPWFTDSNPTDTPVEVQELTMDPNRMQRHINYASRVGASRAYLWGVEWWYFMKEQNNDDRYWEVARGVF